MSLKCEVCLARSEIDITHGDVLAKYALILKNTLEKLKLLQYFYLFNI